MSEKLAETFLSLPREGREEFLRRFADSGNPLAPEWLPILERYHRDLLENEE